jgi:hypothetical protein
MKSIVILVAIAGFVVSAGVASSDARGVTEAGASDGPDGQPAAGAVTPLAQYGQDCWTVTCNYYTQYGTLGTCSCQTCCSGSFCNTTCSPPGCRCD